MEKCEKYCIVTWNTFNFFCVKLFVLQLSIESGIKIDFDTDYVYSFVDELFHRWQHASRQNWMFPSGTVHAG